MHRFAAAPLLPLYNVEACRRVWFPARESRRWLCCHLSHLSVFVTAICSATSLTSCLLPAPFQTHSRSPVYPQHLCRRDYSWRVGSFIPFKYHADIWSRAFVVQQLILNAFLLTFHWHLLVVYISNRCVEYIKGLEGLNLTWGLKHWTARIRDFSLL